MRWLVNPLRDPLSAPQRLDLSVLSRRTPQSVSAEIVHQIPRKPLLHNGVSYDPEDIVRFNGQPLLHALDERFGDSILIVDEPQTISTLLSAQVFSALGDRPGQSGHGSGTLGTLPLHPAVNPPSGRPDDTGAEPPPFDQYPYKSQSSPDLRLFSKSGWGGSRLDVRAGTQWADLTKAWIFYPFDDWNDEINSMYPTSSTHLFQEHINFGGSFLILPKHSFIAGFGDYGWHARVSSVANYG